MAWLLGASLTALVASLALNAALALALWRKTRRRCGRALPERRPDFAAVEGRLRHELARSPASEAFGVKEMRVGQWLCQVLLSHERVPDQASHDGLRRVIKSVSAACGLPGRPAGLFFDEADPARLAGTIVEFGYSPEIGYSHPHEFFGNRLARREKDARLTASRSGGDRPA